MKKICIPLILALCLTACGFHLRGMVDIPTWLSDVAIVNQNNNDKELSSILKLQLEGYNIKVDSDPQSAKYWLIILGSNFQQQIISIGASTNPRQYQLILTVEFILQTRKGQIIKTPSKVIVTRQFTANNDRILGSNDEEAVLLTEMRHDAAIQIINRISRK